MFNFILGVRVSDLKDFNAPGNSPSKGSNQTKKIDHFFKKPDLTNKATQFNEEEIDIIRLKEHFSFVCPHCSSYLQGNDDFYYQHLDSCLRFLNFF